MINLDDNGTAYTTKEMFKDCKSEIEYVQVEPQQKYEPCLRLFC